MNRSPDFEIDKSESVNVASELEPVRNLTRSSLSLLS